MNIIEKIKSVFGKGPVLSRQQIQRLSRLPKNQAQKEVGLTLFEICVSRAKEFVSGELKRGDSPFRGVSGAVFFHEMLAVTFWILNKEAGGGKTLLDELHQNYFKAFSALDTPQDERNNTLVTKYEQYEDNWNEITGHLDEFGLCVVQNMFGKDESVKTRERTFWIIQYADHAANTFCSLKKSLKQVGAL